jgi:hypothetical protein
MKKLISAVAVCCVFSVHVKALKSATVAQKLESEINNITLLT